MTLPSTQSADSQQEQVEDSQIFNLSRKRKKKDKKMKDIYITQVPVSQLTLPASQIETDIDLSQKPLHNDTFDKTLSSEDNGSKKKRLDRTQRDSKKKSLHSGKQLSKIYTNGNQSNSFSVKKKNGEKTGNKSKNDENLKVFKIKLFNYYAP